MPAPLNPIQAKSRVRLLHHRPFDRDGWTSGDETAATYARHGPDRGRAKAREILQALSEPRKRLGGAVVALLFLTCAAAVGQAFDPAETCEGKADGAPCWLQLDSHPGCHVWNPIRKAQVSASWSGQCNGAVAEGEGVLTLADPDAERVSRGALVYEGAMVGGMLHGRVSETYGDGGTAEGTYAAGRVAGRWRFTLANGTVAEGIIANGRRVGRWVERQTNGDVSEMPYVNGEVHGTAVHRFADGRVTEIPYVNGKRHGTEVVRHTDDGVSEIPYVRSGQISNFDPDALRAAAEQGHAWAQADMGWRHHFGFGLEQNRAESERWYKLAAEQGFEPALEALGQPEYWRCFKPERLLIPSKTLVRLERVGHRGWVEMGDETDPADFLEDGMTAAWFFGAEHEQDDNESIFAIQYDGTGLYKGALGGTLRFRCKKYKNRGRF